MSEWPPISTAPRGKTEFLGWDGENMEKTWEGWDECGTPMYVYGDWMLWEPTHWMPLPAPPTASAPSP